MGFEPTIPRPQRDVLPTKLSLKMYTMATGLEPIPLNLEFNILPIKLRHYIYTYTARNSARAIVGQDGIEPSLSRHERDALPIKLLAQKFFD